MRNININNILEGASSNSGMKSAGIGITEQVFDATNNIGSNTINDPNATLREKLAAMKKQGNVSLASTIGKRAVQGGIAGAGTGPGAAVFAAIGGAVGLAEGLINRGKNNDAMSDLKKDVSSSYRDIISQDQELAKGGMVKGKGTGKSDSIKKKLDTGSFVIPKENAGIAKILSKEYFGKDGSETAKSSKTGNDVKVSNGEFVFSPEEAMHLAGMGINLNALAPDNDLSRNFAKGGSVGPTVTEITDAAKKEAKEMLGDDALDKEIEDFVNESLMDVLSNPNVNDRLKAKIRTQRSKENKPFMEMMAADVSHGAPAKKSEEVELSENKKAALAEAKKFSVESKLPETKTTDPIDSKEDPIGKKDNNLAEILGGGQVVAGLIGSARQGDEPDLTVSPRLRRMYGEAAQDAQIGLTQAEKAVTERNIVRSTNNALNSILASGDSESTKYNKAVGILKSKNDAFLDMTAMDSSIRRENKNIARNIESQIVNREHGIQDASLRRYDEEGSAYGNLVTAGITNIVGAGKMKDQLDKEKARKKLGDIFA